MYTDIALIVQKMLLSTGEASIPGVGTVVLQRQGASYDKNKELIYPPSYSLEFKDSVDDNDKLLAYTIGHYKIDEESAKSALAEYTSLLLSELEKVHYFEVNGVGEFTLENQKVLFKPNNVTKDWFAKDLLPIKPIKVDKLYPSIITNPVSKPLVKDHTWRWLPLLFLLCVATIIIKYSYNNSRSTISPKIAKESIETQKNKFQESDSIKQENDSIKSTQTAQSDNSHNSETCVIITGYFAKATNVLKMTSKIENLGYKVFVEDLAGGTRIGIQFDCSNMDLKQKIYNIRDSISKDAWYLIPSITVE